MNVNFIDDGEAVKITSQTPQESNFCGRVKYGVDSCLTSFNFLWINRWYALVAGIFLIQILAITRLQNVSTVTADKDYSNVETTNVQIHLDNLTLVKILQCSDILCNSDYCFCTKRLLVDWFTANDTCHQISPGYSSMVEGQENLRFLKSIKDKVIKEYWIGAYVNQSKDCVWSSGRKFCSNAKEIMNNCLYAENEKVHFTKCNSHYENQFFPICMRANDGRNDSSCKYYNCSSNYCYCVLYSSELHWKTANLICKVHYDTLVYFVNKDEQNFVLKLAPNIKLILGAALSSRFPKLLLWFNSNVGIPFKELVFEEKVVFACYFSNRNIGKLVGNNNCFERKWVVCQMKKNMNGELYYLAEIEQAKKKLNLKRCEYNFCISKFQKCYCVTFKDLDWGNCRNHLGNAWNLTTLNSEEELNALKEYLNAFTPDDRYKYWLAYSNFFNKLKPSWIDGMGIAVNSTIFTSDYRSSCALICRTAKLCFDDCYSRMHSSLCSIPYSYFLKQLISTT